jgi:hypothetical protein
MLKGWLLLNSVAFAVGLIVSLPFSKNIRQSVAVGLATMPAASAGAWAMSRQQGRKAGNSLLEQSVGQAGEDPNFIEREYDQVEKDIAIGKLEMSLLQSRLDELEQQRQRLRQEIDDLTARRRSVESDLADSSEQTRSLMQQESTLQQELAKTREAAQHATEELSVLRQEIADLNSEIVVQRQNKADLLQESVAQSDSLIPQQRQDAPVSEVQTSPSPIAKTASTAEVLGIQDNDLAAEQPPRQRISPDEISGKVSKPVSEAPSVPQTPVSVSPKIAVPKLSQASVSSSRHRATSGQPVKLQSIQKMGRFSNPNYTKELWEDQLLPYWSHRDRPKGQRFLGSLKIEREATDKLLNIVGQNLGRVDRLTVNKLYEAFEEEEQNWLRILTFACSEYAYYYSNERFWQGLCDRLNIQHRQATEDTFRQLVDEGIDLLGLVKAKGGYRFVSTLWIQSGIPEHNLEYFSQLIQELADEYGWWELAHADCTDLAEAIYSHCLEKHPAWGTLINFLKVSCPSENEAVVDPISGQLIQGIAVVAQELERQGLAPQALEDDNHREDLLRHSYLPECFFLRSWKALVQVLTPKARSSRGRTFTSHRPRSLILQFDPTSLDTQLILPQQTVWRSEWKDLRGTFCKILEAGWEDIIPTTGDLDIPERGSKVTSANSSWTWQLQDHNRRELLQWTASGVMSDLPCLIFDSITGEHLPLDPNDPKITGTTEIFCFTSKDWLLETDDGIEIVDSLVPSSIAGWRGRQLELTNPSASICLRKASTESSQIHWQSSTDQPILQGLRLRDKKTVYLNAPTFWYPPTKQTALLNLLIENILKKEIESKTIEELPVSDTWHPIALEQWIAAPGLYEARFWNDTHRWSYRFEVRFSSPLLSAPEVPALQILRGSENCTLCLPLQVNTTDEFWDSTLSIRGLWTLEPLGFLLSNGQDEVSYTAQANQEGELEIRVSALYDLLPSSERYTLKFQRLGGQPQRLIELRTNQEKLTWQWTDDGLEIANLHPAQSHTLQCWNLLTPEDDAILINVLTDSVSQISLNLAEGIYHVQLQSDSEAVENLGWFCDSGQNDLPVSAHNKDELANYCYTILGNESTQDFITAIEQLQSDLSIEWIETLVQSLQKPSKLAAWLDQESLKEKLLALLQTRRGEKTEKTVPHVVTVEISPAPLPQILKLKPAQKTEFHSIGKWYLVETASRKRDLFCTQLLGKREEMRRAGIVSFEKCVGTDYSNHLLIEATDFANAHSLLSEIHFFKKIEPQSLRQTDVDRMLGR